MSDYKVGDRLQLKPSDGRILGGNNQSRRRNDWSCGPPCLFWRWDCADLSVENRSGGSLIRESETRNWSGERRWVKLRGNLRRSVPPAARKECGEPALSFGEGGRSRKGNDRSSSARMPRAGVRSVWSRREARDRAVDAGIEDSVTQD